MKTAIAVLTVIVAVLGGILFLASRAGTNAAAQPVLNQQAEIPQTGISGPGGSQGNPPGVIPVQPAAVIGLAASLVGALVLGFTVLALSGKRSR